MAVSSGESRLLRKITMENPQETKETYSDLEIDLAKTFVMRCIAKKFPVKKAVLFESYRFGDLDQNKCISIALILDPMTNPLKVMTELVRLTWEFTVCIDPYPLSVSDFESSTPTIDEIKRTGTEILL